ncbi:phenylalanine--tRNA ligase subunit beta [Candidatus Peregrinibacteria bacterium]|nr:MAG: phenylalanine--tRNA ligase subunit beta [Candidatus Peregrinibacteria bacterium]
MNISLDWISDFVSLGKKNPAEIGALLTRHTAEVEGIIDLAKPYEKMIVGEVLEIKKHPGADRLNLVQTDIGEKEPVQIVCGGQNLKPGLKVAVALPGAWCKWHGEGEPVQITQAKIRGESSHGMICAGEEIGLPSDNLPGSTEVHICELAKINTEAARAKTGTPLAEVLGKKGAVLEIDNKSLTHRPDLWGHYGIARELAAILEEKLVTLDTFVTHPKPKGKTVAILDIEDKTLCPRFSAAILTGITIEESPLWMKARLEAAGMNVHNNIVDITNYVMLELGQPMHAYDRETIGDTLRVRFAKKGEKLLTLEGGEHPLTEEDPIITNGADLPIGLAGIKGGLHSGIRSETTELVLEAATFDPVAVRKAAARHGLRTDASQRFEKKLDPSLTEMALQRAIHLILKLCPEAKLEGPIHTVGSWKATKKTLSLDPARLCSKIGVEIPDSEITRILKALAFEVKKDGKKLEVTVPSHRASGDVGIEEDLVEEVARLYGYDKIPPLLPALPTQLPIENTERELKHRARNIFAGSLGFTEVMTYSFYGKDRMQKCGLDENEHLKILNPLSEDQTHLRTTLTPNLLAVIAANAREKEKIQIFEIGHSYREVGHYMPEEQKRITAMLAQKEEPFYKAKGALETFLKNFGVENYELRPSEKILPYAHPKKSVDLLVNGKPAGVLFTAHPGTLKAFDIALNVSVFSFHFSALATAVQNGKRFQSLPKFPGMEMDVSVLVPARQTVAELEAAIRSVDNENRMESVELFDIYSGEKIPQNQKSLSFRIKLRHPERTLTDAEFQNLQKSTFIALEKTGAKVRGL